MDCPHCHSPRFSRLEHTTHLGYAMFRCKDCRRTYNERTPTRHNNIPAHTALYCPHKHRPKNLHTLTSEHV